MVSVAVVGNGPSLLDYALGTEIDAHDVVVRIKGGGKPKPENKPQLGLKVSHVCCSNTRGRGTQKAWIFVDSRDKEDLIPKLPKGFYCNAPLCWKWIKRYRELREPYRIAPTQRVHARNSDELGHTHPSAGIFAVLYALDLLSPSRVTLYGYDNVVTGTHGWSMTRGSDHARYPDHNWPAEKKLLNDMIDHYGYEGELEWPKMSLSRR